VRASARHHPPSFAPAILAPRIHEFLANYPGLSLDVAVSSATPDLMRNRADVAITLHEEPQSKLVHFRDGAGRPVDLRFKLLSDNGEVLRRACLARAGIGEFYRFHVRKDIRLNRLVPLLRDYESRPQSMLAITPHRESVSPQAKAFILS
jgi:DNA-binding transcriptional LysR family regulator